MAVKKNFVDDKGVPTNYFRIAHIEENYLNPDPIIVVYVIGYADKSFRDKEKEARDVNVDKSNYHNRFILTPDDTKGYGRNNFYKRLKEEVELFKDAIDEI